MEPTKKDRMESLYDAYRNNIFHLCLFYLRDVQRAEDATQETFLKAWRKFDSFRGGSSEKTWLTSIAVNSCRDWLRKAWLKHEKCAVFPDALTSPAEDHESQEAADVVRAVWELPVKLREVIVLRFYQGLTVKETAKALGISASGVNARQAKAKEMLKPTLWEVYFDA